MKKQTRAQEFSAYVLHKSEILVGTEYGIVATMRFNELRAYSFDGRRIHSVGGRDGVLTARVSGGQIVVSKEQRERSVTPDSLSRPWQYLQRHLPLELKPSIAVLGERPSQFERCSLYNTL